MIVPVILSGGAGTRLWPLSREQHPKQLLPLVDNRTMLQDTVIRLEGIPGLAAPLVICNESHRFMVAEQLRQIEAGAAAIVLEPVGRNTAPAAAIAALQAMAGGDDPVLLVLPADHVVKKRDSFHAVVIEGAKWAEDGRLVIFGVVPERPETGYGYIRVGKAIKGETLKPPKRANLPAPSLAVFAVDGFVEKPDAATARSCLDSGDYLWNSGMFMFKASRFIEELERFAPAMLAACRQAFAGSVRDLDFTRLDAVAFADCPNDSIDYAIMEKTDAALVIPLAAGWSDVGSWSALWEIGERDDDGNVVRGDVFTWETHGCFLHASGRVLATVGLENHVVVETSDAVLVAHKDRVEEVRHIVERLKAQKRNEALLHPRVNRPWGAYERIDGADRFQVKHITVNPGASLSLQMHHHRAEHWVVVRGTARATRGDEVIILSENQSTYIPLGVTHRLENPGKIPLEIIEIQTGSYLGEDDIVRFQDDYGRQGA